MACVVDRVVICDAFHEPERHYRLLTGGRSKLAAGRRPSMRFLASAKDASERRLLAMRRPPAGEAGENS